MLYSRAGIFSEMAQASPTKLSLSKCNYDLYGPYLSSTKELHDWLADLISES